uniref:Helicase/UvrB N-terminal domain-containing protein n=1 Tax=viral metagenome TaxID=1070528 RepID=A0A6C0CFN4_9ZZZZ
MSSGSRASRASIDYDDDFLRGEGTNKRAECIRNRTNFTVPKSYHLVDKKDFNPDMLNLYIDNDASPKLKLLLDKIKLLDEQDMRLSGKLHKHLIFTDVNRSTYGAKILASALTASGMNLVYHPQGRGFSMLDDSELRKTKNNNYAALLSKSFFERPVNTKIRKTVLDKFNSRPDNTYGELIRFIILDQGFKEGIDLFDVKYVHLFEPLAVNADEKQAIGRATRFCGQKGLEFHPRYGWPLYVFKYDVVIPKELKQKYMDSETLFELYIKNSNLDMRKIIFANELEKATIGASVDKELNKAIHQFAIEKPANILKSSGSRSGSRSGKGSRGGGGAAGKPKGAKATPPAKIMNLEKMQEYIKKNFNAFKYPPLVLENKCVGGGMAGGATNGNIVSFTPTQDFVRHYFQPQSAYKGILLHHSVGTGKTCTAIATATTSFDVENYTILWVTRHTLKNDIWKNMFGQVCSISIQDRIKKGLVLPNKITSKSKYISANWIEPISYKQFSNMLLKKNKIYNEMVRRNGSEDPLRKTLLIIDEAHKIYSPTVAKSERPNTNILEKMIQKSYDKSGADSVRIMLMTATPFTEDGMEMIKLLNLLREDDKIEADFGKFSSTYLDDSGYFTNVGLSQFQDKVSGYISYLNRSQDARNFAHPVIKNVFAKMSLEKSAAAEAAASGSSGAKLKMSKADKDNIKEIKSELKELLKQEKALDNHEKELKACIKMAATNYKAASKNIMSQRKEGEKKCKAEPKNMVKACKDKVLAEYNELLKRIERENDIEMLRCADKNRQAKSNSNVKRMLERKKALEAEIAKYNKGLARIKENKEKNKGKREDIKVFTIKKNTLKDKIKALRVSIVDLEEKYKASQRKIGEITDKVERRKAMAELKMSSAYLLAKKELKELRAQASKLNTQQQLMKVSYGFKKIKKISQQYAIDKYCV